MKRRFFSLIIFAFLSLMTLSILSAGVICAAEPSPERKVRKIELAIETLVTMHFYYSDSQISFADSFYADPDYPIDSYVS